jgi:hypothetical protein
LESGERFLNSSSINSTYLFITVCTTLSFSENEGAPPSDENISRFFFNFLQRAEPRAFRAIRCKIRELNIRYIVNLRNTFLSLKSENVNLVAVKGSSILSIESRFANNNSTIKICTKSLQISASEKRFVVIGGGFKCKRKILTHEKYICKSLHSRRLRVARLPNACKKQSCG